MKQQKARVISKLEFPPVTAETARRFNLTVHSDPLKKRPAPIGCVSVENLWVESPLPSDPRWLVACRMSVHNDRLVVTELRIFPAERDAQGLSSVGAGQWSAQWLGFNAAAPPGGLSTRAIRSVRLGYEVRSLQEVIEREFETQRREREPHHNSLLSRLAELHEDRLRPAKAGAPRRGRARLPEKDYVKLAAKYADIIRRGSKRPIQDLASQLGMPIARIRARIHRARQLGILGGGVQGTAGGKLIEREREKPGRVRQ